MRRKEKPQLNEAEKKVCTSSSCLRASSFLASERELLCTSKITTPPPTCSCKSTISSTEQLHRRTPLETSFFFLIYNSSDFDTISYSNQSETSWKKVTKTQSQGNALCYQTKLTKENKNKNTGTKSNIMAK